MEAGIFLYIGAMLLLALLVKVFSRKLKIPEVTGDVLLGVLLGGSVLNLLSADHLTRLGPISTVALGIIAFMIGVELKLDVLKRLGRPIFFIVIFESFGAFALVLVTQILFFPDSVNQALLLGAVAAATAPAATVAVIRQYKAKGPLTSTILAVVGIDDAVALIIYVFASSVVRSSLEGAHLEVIHILLQAGLSVLISIALGALSAMLFVFLVGKRRENDLIGLGLAAFILALVGIADMLGVSELLSIMVFGALVTNLSPILSKKTEGIVEYFAPVFVAAFFVLGGAHLDVRLIGQIGLIGLAYFLARSVGKITGGTLGAAIGRAPGTIRKYVGFSLLPQVGVALALALSIDKTFNIPKYGTAGHDMAVLIINVLLFTTILTEILGPFMTRTVLRKSGEVEE
ncbi:MAG TPA: cation:proton antiporter [Spirochaetia bacterium]|nr:cation:proton antiporter [Spirochaetia bacterium]